MLFPWNKHRLGYVILGLKNLLVVYDPSRVGSRYFPSNTGICQWGELCSSWFSPVNFHGAIIKPSYFMVPGFYTHVWPISHQNRGKPIRFPILQRKGVRAARGILIHTTCGDLGSEVTNCSTVWMYILLQYIVANSITIAINPNNPSMKSARLLWWWLSLVLP